LSIALFISAVQSFALSVTSTTCDLPARFFSFPILFLLCIFTHKEAAAITPESIEFGKEKKFQKRTEIEFDRAIFFYLFFSASTIAS
jgi:hypothetical protein